MKNIILGLMLAMAVGANAAYKTEPYALQNHVSDDMIKDIQASKLCLPDGVSLTMRVSEKRQVNLCGEEALVTKALALVKAWDKMPVMLIVKLEVMDKGANATVGKMYVSTLVRTFVGETVSVLGNQIGQTKFAFHLLPTGNNPDDLKVDLRFDIDDATLTLPFNLSNWEEISVEYAKDTGMKMTIENLKTHTKREAMVPLAWSFLRGKVIRSLVKSVLIDDNGKLE